MKDIMQIQENCQNIPLHSSIYGGEIASFYLLLNFESYLPAEHSIISENILHTKIQMIEEREVALNTPLMLCITNNRIEMFIYLLSTFEEYYRHQGGLMCIDIDGNTVLHLIASLSDRQSLHFAKILLNYSQDQFIKNLNKGNNQGCTPLFVAVQRGNNLLVEYLMQNSSLPLDITIKNKNGETIKEYIERNQQDSDELIQVFNKYQNRILVRAVLGLSKFNFKSTNDAVDQHNFQVLSLKFKDSVRALLNNYRHDKEYFKQAVGILTREYAHKYRILLIGAYYVFIMLSFNLFTLWRVDYTPFQNVDKRPDCTLSYVIFHISIVMSTLLSIVIINSDK